MILLELTIRLRVCLHLSCSVARDISDCCLQMCYQITLLMLVHDYTMLHTALRGCDVQVHLRVVRRPTILLTIRSLPDSSQEAKPPLIRLQVCYHDRNDGDWLFDLDCSRRPTNDQNQCQRSHAECSVPDRATGDQPRYQHRGVHIGAGGR